MSGSIKYLQMKASLENLGIDIKLADAEEYSEYPLIVVDIEDLRKEFGRLHDQINTLRELRQLEKRDMASLW